MNCSIQGVLRMSISFISDPWTAGVEYGVDLGAPLDRG
jgi:hypothetical protein